MTTPTPVTDAYDNPTPHLDYGPDAPQRVLWGLFQPEGSTESAGPARHAVITRWRLFTLERLTARERVTRQNRVFEVVGEPDEFAPRFGHTHYETRLVHVEG
ncbi:hypothetical protein [Umezawaea sp. Da 62-37]|uniref:hypothetical protein n=1 Tax=Umezawaea sp. Da 62-37 TaxID=3075927 RepID=UPI0028F6F4BC|nr:hypothetical protein [Umezawaea sp. Da 62-37]WNV82215.1 hypothetical protein RM788_28855 [Umezawaea sp. Da 62-37]